MNNSKVPSFLIPSNEKERIQKLYTYDILDTPSDITFDKIAFLAAQIFNTPIAQITFVDEERVFFKSNISPLEATEIDRKDSFCSTAILNDGVNEIVTDFKTQDEFTKLYKTWVEVATDLTDVNDLISFVKTRQPNRIFLLKKDYDSITKGKVIAATEKEYFEENN